MQVRARWVVPVGGPPVENGVVVAGDGVITSIERESVPNGGPVIDVGDAALLPGFVNAHTHLELSGLAGLISPPGQEPDAVLNWLAEVIRLRGSEAVAAFGVEAVRSGIRQSLNAGVTTVGDISRTNLAWPALKESPLRAVCFAELISLADQPPTTLWELRATLDRMETDDRLMAGLSPHTPYTVTEEHLRGCFAMAGRRGLPVTVHLSEGRAETQWLGDGTGPISTFLANFPAAAITSPRTSAVEYLDRVGGLVGAPLLAHVNYIDDSELELLSGANATVAYCPRTHAYFGHEPHRFREMLGLGINVCVGTDSLGSSPTLSVLDELRYLRQEFPDLDGRLLLEMGTLRGAHGLGLGDRVGSLLPGKQADLVVIPLDPAGSPDPETNVLSSDRQPEEVWIGGACVGNG